MRTLIVEDNVRLAALMSELLTANGNVVDVSASVDEARTALRTTLHTLRQQDEKPPGKPNRALADFVAPKESGKRDYVGAFAVCITGADELAKKYGAKHDDYNAILVKALADRLAEAFAERLHERVRKEFWGYAGNEALDNDALVRSFKTDLLSQPRAFRLLHLSETDAATYVVARNAPGEDSVEVPWAGDA